MSFDARLAQRHANFKRGAESDLRRLRELSEDLWRRKETAYRPSWAGKSMRRSSGDIDAKARSRVALHLRPEMAGFAESIVEAGHGQSIAVGWR